MASPEPNAVFWKSYENRETAEGRRIGLYVAVLPALGTETKPDPLFLLAGGPGMAATELANAAKTHLRRIREQREIVLVDQRGTGKSNGLDCADVDSTTQSFNVDFPFQALRDCAEALDADLRLYTTPIATEDLDDVRAALGYGSINLWGGSYGTRAALVYLRRHPDRVRTVILDGLAPPDMRLPLHFGEDANRAFDLTFGDCKEDVDCNTAFPNLRDTYHELLDRLEKAPESVRVAHPRTGEMEEIDFGRDDVFLQLRAALYSPDATRLLPLVIQRAHDGDYGPLLALSEPFAEVGSLMSVGMLFSVLCSEDISFIDDADLAWMAAEPSRRTSIVGKMRQVCDAWPLGPLPEGYHDPVVSDKPVLVLSGKLDPVTPPQWGDRVARHLSNAMHVVVPGAAHGTMAYGCVQRLMAQFIDEANVDSLDPDCAAGLDRPMFFHSNTGPRAGTEKAVTQ